VQINQADIIQQTSQQYLISGIVDFSTVPGLMRQASGLLSASKSSASSPIAIDFSQVKECNSAALALMLELLKSGQQKGIELYFENLPATVLTIARAYGLEDEIREFCR
jgi:phospholipid transport system transporter-binding protein